MACWRLLSTIPGDMQSLAQICKVCFLFLCCAMLSWIRIKNDPLTTPSKNFKREGLTFGLKPNNDRQKRLLNAAQYFSGSDRCLSRSCFLIIQVRAFPKTYTQHINRFKNNFEVRCVVHARKTPPSARCKYLRALRCFLEKEIYVAPPFSRGRFIRLHPIPLILPHTVALKLCDHSS